MAYTLKKKTESYDDGKDLMCSAHGCPQRWSVEGGNGRLCSYHAWEPTQNWPRITQDLQSMGPWKLGPVREPVVYDKNSDTKAWAHRLKRMDDAGIRITTAVREMYKRALRLP